MLGTPRAIDFDQFKMATKHLKSGILTLHRMSSEKGPQEFYMGIHGLVDQILRETKLLPKVKGPRTAFPPPKEPRA